MTKRVGISTVRIIGGTWRGRKLPVVAADGLRPSGDRSRETLFNWLQPRIEGMRCLDLCAGSGALGFEAASRGARRVVLVEKQRAVVAQLHESRQLLKADQVEVVTGDAKEYLQKAAETFDLVFLDPPFEANLHLELLAKLPSVLADQAMVYVEMPKQFTLPDNPSYRLQKTKSLGNVLMVLLVYQDLTRAGAST